MPIQVERCALSDKGPVQTPVSRTGLLQVNSAWITSEFQIHTLQIPGIVLGLEQHEIWVCLTMTDVLESRLRPSKSAVQTQMGDETVLLHLESGIYFGMDAVGSQIWEQIRAGKTATEICAAIAQEYDVPLKTVEEDARVFISNLLENGIAIAE